LSTNFGAYDGGFARQYGNWGFCAITRSGAQPLTGNCSIGGKTWSPFQRLTPEISDSALPDELRGLVEQLDFKRGDGAFIIGVVDTDRTMNALQFDPIKGTWITLGQIAMALLSYAPNASGGAGILWAIPVGGSPDAWQTNIQTTTGPFQRS
jgi:hypothetical protein